MKIKNCIFETTVYTLTGDLSREDVYVKDHDTIVKAILKRCESNDWFTSSSNVLIHKIRSVKKLIDGFYTRIDGEINGRKFVINISTITKDNEKNNKESNAETSMC